ncbi:hypothetical protein Ato02nite_096670 [Paractinoplanes toevensis]|uniref:SDR family oxidoreductase n=1 Tax=Paractinoplanes toevensis TaxID=571911 RepID=A0A920BR01_9ACTN|nr:hypothetical protein Ato02nite_096670 [Actinoplanes toevensis]
MQPRQSGRRQPIPPGCCHLRRGSPRRCGPATSTPTAARPHRREALWCVRAGTGSPVAKGGIVALTLATARGCARYGVRANAICPRARTAMTGSLMGAPPDGPDPLSPARVAPLVTYLAGPAGERITGEVFVAHGDVVALLGPPTVRAAFPGPG